MALDPHFVDGWVEGCLERIGEDHPEEELLFRDLFEDETQREVVIESLQAFEISQSILYRPACKVGTCIVTYTTITEDIPQMEAGYGGATLYMRAGN